MMLMQQWERGLAWETAASMGAEAVPLVLVAGLAAAALPMVGRGRGGASPPQAPRP